MNNLNIILTYKTTLGVLSSRN